ncbi:ABC transporter permease [Listeria fleischmannii 1991]|uniref:Predicted permease n=2 Tax=Listeria fleischmannii TaxID=1069827 RepID=A0A2X3GS08_9LIST|nr:permease [Listeria fleischmannii]KMT58860.1 ABC transporter permease [Listeria fleischmannii 1991]SQC70932.1 Predicted permease [Listeria fleischmannii subsp. fleischmannii]
MFSHLPNSFLQMNTIFISILIEALPFVLIGVFIAGFIQMFISEKFIARVIPKNRFLAVVVGSCIGVLFPSCECGIVPIVRNLLKKGVPLHAGIAFMLTAPIINPVVLFSTYVAFGSTWEIPILRVVGSLVVAMVVGNLIAFFYKGEGLKEKILNTESDVKEEVELVQTPPLMLADSSVPVTQFTMLETSQEEHHHSHEHAHHSHTEMNFGQKLWHTAQHSVDEFFSVGKYLVFGAFIAAAMQTYIKTSTLMQIGHGPILSILLMMVLAFILSLCSEADAFIGASFRSIFSTQSIVAFLVFGPMLDIKNLMMMLASFKVKFVLFLVTTVTIVVFIYALII